MTGSIIAFSDTETTAMKITANQHLIPYFQPRRDTFPANQPDEKNHPELNRRFLSDDSLQSGEQQYRYYIRQDLENSIYNRNKNIISPDIRTKGMIIDLYA
ncbi:MAG: hypothetical protein ABIK15_13200 [Pseudomonadota bacterium]